MWEADRRHGYGTLSRADGTRYVGMFVHDMKHGQGQLFFPNGTVKIEDWLNGQQLSIKKVENPDQGRNSVDLTAENQSMSAVG